MRVLISAYACDPVGTSERGLGWAWVAAAGERHDVCLLTRPQFKQAISAALRARLDLRITPVYLDPPRWLTWWKRGKRGLYPFYFLWQLMARHTAASLHRQNPYDVGHHLTFALDWLPAGIAFIPGLPVVWGPVGPGVVLPPLTLGRVLGLRWIMAEMLRALITSSLRRLFGWPTARRSAIVVGNNCEVAAEYAWHPNVVLEQHAVIDRPLGVRGSNRDDCGRAAVAVARLLSWKGIDLAIEAIRHAPGWTLTIYGRGPAEDRLRRRVARRQLSDRVHFGGSVSRNKVLAAMGVADVLLFPSVRDSAPGAVAEAVTIGLPVICLDLGGPGAMVRPGEGIKIRADRHVVANLTKALESMPARHAGAPRWSSARLGPLLDNWYCEASRATPETTVPAGV